MVDQVRLDFRLVMQVGAAAAAAAQAAAAHDIQKQELQKSITLLQLELQSTVGAKQQQEKLVSHLP